MRHGTLRHWQTYTASYRLARHAIDGLVDLRSITATHLVAEAVGWGLPRELVRDTVVEVAQAVGAAAQTTAADEPIAFIVDVLTRRAERFAAPAWAPRGCRAAS